MELGERGSDPRKKLRISEIKFTNLHEKNMNILWYYKVINLKWKTSKTAIMSGVVE